MLYPLLQQKDDKALFKLDDDFDSEKFYGKKVISGIKCMVLANKVTGMIKGHVSCNTSNKSYKFDFMPSMIERFGEVVISKELDRLYFDIVLVNGKDKIKLLVKDKQDG